VAKIDSIFNFANEIIDDKRINGPLADRHKRRAGHWRAEMITLPLVNPVCELQAG
jgi:hypothetical protein